MKLILCPHCFNIAKLRRYLTACECGRSYGAYLNSLKAVYAGDAIPLGIDNTSLTAATKTQPASGKGKCFEAFVIPKKCPTFTKVEKVETAQLTPKDPKCRVALQALVKSMDTALPGVIGRRGAILVRNQLARRLGPKRFAGERYVAFELTAIGQQACRDLGLAPDEEVTFGGQIRETGIKRGPHRGIQPKR